MTFWPLRACRSDPSINDIQTECRRRMNRLSRDSLDTPTHRVNRLAQHRRPWGFIALCSCLIAPLSAMAELRLKPSSIFLQAGARSSTHTLHAGLTWHSDWQKPIGVGRLSGYLEASIAEWRYEGAYDGSKRRLSQFAVTPALRWRPSGDASLWFVEAGIGLSLTSSYYETNNKRFSTRFNFGTHLGLGRNFGNHREQEISVRIQHFSNAGLKQPNPGENFIQLRYTYRFQ